MSCNCYYKCLNKKCNRCPSVDSTFVQCRDCENHIKRKYTLCCQCVHEEVPIDTLPSLKQSCEPQNLAPQSLVVYKTIKQKI
jgi:hypothetical protein